ATVSSLSMRWALFRFCVSTLSSSRSSISLPATRSTWKGLRHWCTTPRPKAPQLLLESGRERSRQDQSAGVAGCAPTGLLAPKPCSGPPAADTRVRCRTTRTDGRALRRGVTSAATSQFLVAPAHHDQLPGVRVNAELADLGGQVADAGRAAHDQHGKPMLVQPEAPPKGLLFSRRRRAKPEVDRQAEKLDAVGGHA